MINLSKYVRNLNGPRITLWCYLFWYLVIFIRYFDPSLRLWLTSLGISAIIGTALYISSSNSQKGKVKLDQWQIFRLYMMPFCVSSFSALIKGKGFILIFSPIPLENGLAAGIIIAFIIFVKGYQTLAPKT
ncbi:MAG: hypothetical protein JWM04_291 [Verrucomicrobiales bacterium]|jgi:hypothetical protein|nr:hypothetical protein [Verrucomicrobiales bacterium]